LHDNSKFHSCTPLQNVMVLCTVGGQSSFSAQSVCLQSEPHSMVDAR